VIKAEKAIKISSIIEEESVGYLKIINDNISSFCKLEFWEVLVAKYNF
jgi:hypothetical protein